MSSYSSLVSNRNSRVHIWNRALARVGESVRIASETESTVAAEACRLHYEDCLREALSSAAWPFATKQSQIAQVAGASRTGWDYIYSLPTDCLRPLALLDEDQRIVALPRSQRAEFAVMLNDNEDGQILCTNLDSADFEVLEYIALVETIPAMTDTFKDALAWKLAAELALELRKDLNVASACLNAYSATLSKARAEDFQRQLPAADEALPPSVVARG